MKIVIKFLFLSFTLINYLIADEIRVFDFTESELAKLEVRKVRGAENKTVYTVGSNENGNFLKAVAENAASGLGKDCLLYTSPSPRDTG